MRLIILRTLIIISASTAFSQPLKDLGARGTTLPAAYARAPDTNDVIVARHVANEHTEAQLPRPDEPIAGITMAWGELTNKPKPRRLETLKYVLHILSTLSGVTFLMKSDKRAAASGRTLP